MRYAIVVIAAISLGLLSGCLWTGPEIVITRYETSPGQYVELKGEDLKEYPALDKAISGEGCTKENENSWRCKINPGELSRTMAFTIEKRQNYSGEVFFKVSEKYYAVAYITD